ncbi:MAG TPA: hydantoinase/oxoprolinase N-terminal domain-containing protein [Candidatus Binatus sp.]|nr:hydantoinase/oxoprolinase N-terminal domain-containing protein [Candidatus Binatus sp.]
MKRRSTAPILVGIDTGGTFTDLVALVGREVHVHKVLSTPADPPTPSFAACGRCLRAWQRSLRP